MRALYVELRVHGVGLLQEQKQPPEIGVIKEWKLIEINSFDPYHLPINAFGSTFESMNTFILIYKYVGRYDAKDVNQELAVKTARELQSKGFFDFTIQIEEDV